MKTATKRLIVIDQQLSRLHSAHSTYILSEILTCAITMHEYTSSIPQTPPKNITINKKTGDLIGPWGKNVK